MAIPELFTMTAYYLNDAFPGSTFVGGSYDHAITTGLWELTNEDYLLKVYEETLQNHGITAKAMKPALRLSSSDVGISGANLSPMLIYGNDHIIILGHPIKLEHKAEADLDKFEERLKMIFSQYIKAINGLTVLLSIDVRNPINCMTGVMKRIGVPKKLAFEAVDLSPVYFQEKQI